MTSIFDPNVLKAMTFEGSNSTESIPVPVGEWPFIVDSFKIDAWTKRDDPTTGGLKFTAMLDVSCPEVSEKTKREKNLVRFEGFLDMTPDGGLDFGEGMNVSLGRFRTAVKLNTPGMPWTFDMFVGRTGGRAKVSHRAHPDRPGQMVADVKDVVA